MNNDRRIMELSLPVPEAAELTTKAAEEGVPTSEYLGVLALTGAYGVSHPVVVAFRNRPKAGINGPQTPKGTA